MSSEDTFRAPWQPLSGRAIAAALGPRPVVVVGTVRDGRANFTPVAFCAPLSYEPPLVAWCGSHSGRNTDKSEGFTCAWEEAGGTALPYPARALSTFTAKVSSVGDAGDHRLFVLEIEVAATRLPSTEKGRLATEPTLLCLEHTTFATAGRIS